VDELKKFFESLFNWLLSVLIAILWLIAVPASFYLSKGPLSQAELIISLVISGLLGIIIVLREIGDLLSEILYAITENDGILQKLDKVIEEIKDSGNQADAPPSP
jgi:hypothetical protein